MENNVGGTLQENPYLPCVSLFAVYFLSGTRQRATLPCATTKTPGLKKTHGKSILCRVLFLAHGKIMLCRMHFLCHTAKSIVCRVPKKNTRQSMDLPCVLLCTRQNNNFVFLLSTRNFFYSLHITCVTSY